MSNHPSVIQWKQPSLVVDEETDAVTLDLGEVHLPPTSNPDNMEQMLTIISDLITQMVEEDILPNISEAPAEPAGLFDDIEADEGYTPFDADELEDDEDEDDF